ncbi:MAG: hypothetical protein H6774_02890 [Pseudomonadales bacterium]|nr:hypothetical protein [Candidatus Woesebacteria bacterium]MCB9802012.1 hypothetical protein [Pseudomonadales bacterium]
MKRSIIITSCIAWVAVLGSGFAIHNLVQIYAQDDPTPTTSPTAETELTTEELKKRIEKAVEEKREQVQGVISEALNQKTATIGEVERISEESLTINHNDTATIIPLTDELTITKSSKVIEADAIAVGNWVVAIGTQDELDEFTPTQLRIFDATILPDPQTVNIGSITDISATAVTIESRKVGETTTFTISQESEFQNQNGELLQRTSFEEDMQVLVVGSTDSDDEVQLKTMRSLVEIADES